VHHFKYIKKAMRDYIIQLDIINIKFCCSDLLHL